MSCQAATRPAHSLLFLSAIACVGFSIPPTLAHAEESAPPVSSSWSPANESLTATPVAGAGSGNAALPSLQVISTVTSRTLNGLQWQAGDKFEGVDLSGSLGQSLSLRAFTAATAARSLTAEAGDGGTGTLAHGSGSAFQFGQGALSGMHALSGWSLDRGGSAAALGFGGTSSDERVARQQATFQSGGFSINADLSKVGSNFRAPQSAEGLTALQSQDFGYSLGARQGTDRRAVSATYQPVAGLGLSMQSERLTGAGNEFGHDQYGFQAGNTSLSFSRLTVGSISSQQLGQELVGKLNEHMAARSKLGAAQDTLLTVANAAALTGLQQQDYALTSQFGSGLKLTAEGNQLAVGQGRFVARDESLSLDKLQVSHRTRDLSHNLTAAQLTALGHKALVGQIGHATEEWTANWQASDRLSLQHYRKEDLLNATGNPTDGSTTRITQNNLVWQPSDSLRLTALNQTVESGIASGQSAQATTKTQTYGLAKSWGANTTLALTRNMTDTRTAGTAVAFDQTHVQFSTARADRFSLSADLDRQTHSQTGDSLATKAAIAFTPSQRLSLTANTDRVKSDALGATEKTNYGLAYDLGNNRKLTAGLATTAVSAAGATNETQTLSFALQPAKNTTVTLIDAQRTQGDTSVGFQRLDLRTSLGNSSSLSFRTDRESIADGTAARTDTFLLTTKQGPYTMQLGHKSRAGAAGVNDGAAFLRLEAEPIQGTKLALRCAGASGQGTVPLRDWSFSTKLGSVELTGSHVYNKGKDTAGDEILPVAKAFDPLSTESYSLKTKLSARWSMAAGLSANENLLTAVGTREKSLSFFTSNQSKTQLQLKFRRGTSVAAGNSQHYSVFEMSHSWNLAADRQVTFAARKIHGAGVELFPGGEFEAQLSGQWAF